jgi:hypothetical protein
MASTVSAPGNAADDRSKRRIGREEERERLLKQIKRGLDEIDVEMRAFTEAYSRFLASGAECDDRLASWTKFFNEVALVSEDREEQDASNKRTKTTRTVSSSSRTARDTNNE